MEEVYEQCFRILPGASWFEGHLDKKPHKWSDFVTIIKENTQNNIAIIAFIKFLFKKGDKSTSKDEIELAENWKWDDDWTVDINRAVDNEGWEYCVEPSMGGWSPSEKIYHLNKRRRWIRNRSYTASIENTVKTPTTRVRNMSILGKLL